MQGKNTSSRAEHAREEYIQLARVECIQQGRARKGRIHTAELSTQGQNTSSRAEHAREEYIQQG
jgi:hypothetical protein